MSWCRARYGARFTVRLTGFPPLVFLSDPGEIRAMLAAPADVLHPGEGGNAVMPIVGRDSFMLLDGDRHLGGRRTVLPAFHARLVRGHADWIGQVAAAAVASWPCEAELALHPRLRTLTLEVILRKVLAQSSRASPERLAELRDSVLAMLAVTGSPVFPQPILRRGPGRRVWDRFLADRAETDARIHALIEASIATPAPDSEDVLAHLLGAAGDGGSRPSRGELRDNVMSLLLAGHETTAAQLAWAFQLIAHNPEVQERLIEEIDADDGEEYLTATILEVLRHRSVFLFAIPRAVKQPLQIGGWRYEPPVRLVASIYLVHHDPALYPEPDRFRPERFLGGQPSSRVWLPWGGGRRRCPGSHLAVLEMKTVLRAVLSQVSVTPASTEPERPRWRSVIVSPHRGSRVVLHRRRLRAAPGTHRRRARTVRPGPADGHRAKAAKTGSRRDI